MKIAFLHFDGVITSFKSYQDSIEKNGARAEFDVLRNDAVDPTLVARLNTLAAEGCQFVVASSWRHSDTLETLSAVLQAAGLNGALLGMLGDEPADDDAIEVWMNTFAPPDAKFVVFESGKIGKFESNTIVCVDGVSDRDIKEASRILGTKRLHSLDK